ncbi:hypothetical protein ACCS53_39215, partial [Rhizobium ruizarguesonis]
VGQVNKGQPDSKGKLYREELVNLVQQGGDKQYELLRYLQIFHDASQREWVAAFRCGILPPVRARRKRGRVYRC